MLPWTLFFRSSSAYRLCLGISAWKERMLDYSNIQTFMVCLIQYVVESTRTRHIVPDILNIFIPTYPQCLGAFMFRRRLLTLNSSPVYRITL